MTTYESTAMARTETSNERFDAVAREAAAIARSTVIPDAYKGNPGNCLIAMDVAKRMGLPALTVMQNLHVIKGRPSWSSSFLIAAVNQSGRFSPLRYRFSGEGEDYGCHCEAVDHFDGEVLVGTKITKRMVKAEGWWSKKDSKGNETSKWQTMEEQMFRYRAAAFWARAFAPELSVGFHTREEIEDVAHHQTTQRRESLAAALDAPDEPPVIVAEAAADEIELDLLEGSLPFEGGA